MSEKLSSYTFVFVAALCGVIVPRIFLLGGYPMGDEGIYATTALSQFASPCKKNIKHYL